MPRDIYEFAYHSRRVALAPNRNRPVLLDNAGSNCDAFTMHQYYTRGTGRRVVLPREAWEAARVA